MMKDQSSPVPFIFSSSLAVFLQNQRKMNVLSRRILHKCAMLDGICALPENLFLRSYSSTTRQEFGRQFEEIVAQCLQKFSFDVAVCGGPKDRGIDFRGVWLLKSSPVRVIGQCKRYKRRLGPKHVRELEGTLAHEVKGTLGIIVTECGYSKDAYEVFMGSLYPIAFTTLKGFSDDLLRWYSDEGNNEISDANKDQGSTKSEISLQVQNKPTDTYLPGHTEIVDDCNSSFPGTSNKEVISKNGQHQCSANNEKYFNHSNSNQKNITYDNKTKLDISSSSDGRSSFRGNVIDDKPQTSCVTDDGDHIEQLSNSNISEIGTGIFTMFELNPSARKLLPNLVVGMKYRRHNSKVPELFINEDDSFVSVTK